MPTFTNNTKPGNDHAIVGVAEKGIGVHGTSDTSTGTGGVSGTGIGVHGVSKDGGTGVRGDAENGGIGVFGWSQTSSGVGGMTGSGIGVHGVSQSGVGVRGDCDTFQGVYGHSHHNAGVVGESNNMHGVFGICHNLHGAGVYGTNVNDAGGFGIQGESRSGRGVFGHSETADGSGVWGEATRGRGVVAISEHDVGLFGKGGRLAGLFEGDIEVTGDIRLTNADCAEEFYVDGPSAEPGTVMVLGDDEMLLPSYQAYDKCVAGVISGAGSYKPGIVLDKQESPHRRLPLALIGKVFCKVDARFGAIAVGDLLTTSPTPGHAMRADDPLRAFGAVLGKALHPLKEGQGLVGILVALQ